MRTRRDCVLHSHTTVADAAVPKQYGAIPWRIDRNGNLQLLMIRHRLGGPWSFPGGLPAEGCSPARSAARRAFEEAGVVGQLSTEPIGSFRCMEAGTDGAIEPETAILFTLHVRGTLLNWPGKTRRKRDWRSVEEAVKLVKEPELIEFLRSLEVDPKVRSGSELQL